MAKENENALKHLFDLALLKRMGRSIHKVCPTFDEKKLAALMPKLQNLEMKPRVRLIRDFLFENLPKHYKKSIFILLKSAGDDTLSGFDLWPYTEFVQTYGLDNTDLSLKALAELTKRFTSEFAVRPFLIQSPAATLKFLEQCARSSGVDLRRWASEGSRPRLPWGERLQDFVRDPKPTLKILETLKFDSELYVRKSVANHLNDIAKDHPDYVVKLLTRWRKEAGEKNRSKIEWTIRHALRSLIKDGYPGALKLIGVDPSVKIKIKDLKLEKSKFKIGEKLNFSFKIKSDSKQKQKIVVDYIIHYAKANKKTSAKVFKLKNVILEPRTEVKILKTHKLNEVTTRRHYSGAHVLEIQVNGIVLDRVSWLLQS